MEKRYVKFSIIIPTRERCDTLHWALKTCTEQNYDNLEIIVSDNFSRDNTREVVESNPDERIRYVNTGKSLSMAHNYEFALAHATGDYVTIIGDDDGMITNVLDEVSQIVEDRQPHILTWDKATYVWPNYKVENERDLLILPYRRKNLTKKIDPETLLDSICKFGANYTKTVFSGEFPSIYHGFVNRKTIDSARSAQGLFFNSRIPDVYSGMALASVVTDFWHSTRSFSVRGASSHSIGAAQFGGDDGAKSPATQFLEDENIPFHPNMSFCYSLPIMIIESLLQVDDHMPAARKMDFDAKLLIDAALREMVYKPQKINDEIIKAIKYIGGIYGIEAYANEAISNNINKPPLAAVPVLHGYHPFTKSYVIDGKKEQIDNVYDAAKYCEEVLKDDSLGLFLKQNYHFAANALRKKGITEIAKKIFSPFFQKFASAR